MSASATAQKSRNPLPRQARRPLTFQDTSFMGASSLVKIIQRSYCIGILRKIQSPRGEAACVTARFSHLPLYFLDFQTIIIIQANTGALPFGAAVLKERIPWKRKNSISQRPSTIPRTSSTSATPTVRWPRTRWPGITACGARTSCSSPARTSTARRSRPRPGRPASLPRSSWTTS